MKTWRLLLSGSNDPYYNMALDEAIARIQVAGKSMPTLRIYGWEPAGFSLGYFQKTDSVLNTQRCIDNRIPFVRRFTGGEIIFHNQELTYSVSCCELDLPVGSSVVESFKYISSFILRAYRMLGLEADYCSDLLKKPGFDHAAKALCFASKEDYDIQISGRKIGGCSQRRIKQTVFQHGSIPLDIDLGGISGFLNDPVAGVEEKAISLNEAAGRKISFQELSDIFVRAFTDTFNICLVKIGLTAEEVELARVLKKDKYETPEWNLFRKSPEILFTMKC